MRYVVVVVQGDGHFWSEAFYSKEAAEKMADFARIWGPVRNAVVIEDDGASRV
jgi:hypothetical protein